MPCAAFPLGPMTRGIQELRALRNLIRSMTHGYRFCSMSECPRTPPGPISLSEIAGLAACGETGMVGSLSGPVVAIRSRPTVPIRPRRAREISFFAGGIMGGRTPSITP